MHKRYVAILLSCLAVCATSGCDEGISALVGGVCSLGETACENGKLKVCALTSWQTTDCPDGCDDAGKVCRIPDGKECAVDTCDAGANNILKRCVDGVYKPEPCPTDKPVCQGMACVAEKCEVGKVKCSDDLSATVTCSVTGEWGEPVKCDDGKVCDVAKKSCESKENAAVCENDAMKCKQEGDKSYYVCKDGQWSTEAKSCDGDKVCKGADGKAECKENTTEPDPNKCTVGAKMCDGTNIKTCKEDGTWGTPEPCEQAGYVCDANKNECVPASDQSECTNGKLKCEDSDITPNQYRLCVEGKWNTKIDKCPNDKPVCTADGCQPVGQDMCKNGAKKCVGDSKFQVCENGTWSAESACQAGEKCDKGECVTPAECIDGAKKCKDPGMTTVIPTDYYTCVGGKWSAETQKCSNGKSCKGEPGAAYCDPEDTADCRPGEKRCVNPGNTPGYQICVLGTKGTYWGGEVQACSTLCLNLPGNNGRQEGKCVECDPTEKPVCDGEDNLKACSKTGTWITSSCANDGKVCIDKTDGGNCYDCKANDRRCHSTATASEIQSCNASNNWAQEEMCAAGKACDPKTLTCENKCTHGEGRCNDDGSFDICIDGAWSPKAQCGDKNKCRASKEGNAEMGCKCNENEKVCDAAHNEILVCSKLPAVPGPNGLKYMAYETVESCGNNKCVDAKTEGNKVTPAYCKCDMGTYRCDGQALQYCRVGQWETYLKCDPLQTCDAELGACNVQCGKVTSSLVNVQACAGWDLLYCPASDDPSFSGKYEVRKECTSGCMMKFSAGKASEASCIEDNTISIPNITQRCSKDGKSIEKKNNDSQWVLDSSCKANQQCVWTQRGLLYKPECVKTVCQERELSCSKDGKTITMCVNNQWDEVGKCSDKAKCDNGKCISMIKK